MRAGPRRRPTHYTVTVPSSCWTPAGPPRLPHAPLSCSEDSGSDGSSVSHATSPGSSSPDICALRPLSPPVPPPGPRGAWGLAMAHPALLPPGPLAAGRYVLVAERRLPPGEERALALRPRGRPTRSPSLKDSSEGRVLCRATVSQELQLWLERAHLRGTRPHSLDRQGAFRVRSLPPGRAPASRAQVRSPRAWRWARPARRAGPGRRTVPDRPAHISPPQSSPRCPPPSRLEGPGERDSPKVFAEAGPQDCLPVSGLLGWLPPFHAVKLKGRRPSG